MATYLLNPYLGNVNPGSVDSFKLYIKAIAAPDDKLIISQRNARDIMGTFEMDSNKFGWGPAISNIQIDDLTVPTVRSVGYFGFSIYNRHNNK